jgi:hypothetical protein
MNELQIGVIISAIIASVMSGIWVCYALNSKTGTIIGISFAVIVFIGFIVALPYYMCDTYKMCSGFIIKI